MGDLVWVPGIRMSSQLWNQQYSTACVLLLGEELLALWASSLQASCWPAPPSIKPSLPSLLPRATFSALLGLQHPAARGAARPLQRDPILSYPSLSFCDLMPPHCQCPPVSHFSNPPVLSSALGIILHLVSLTPCQYLSRGCGFQPLHQSTS